MYRSASTMCVFFISFTGGVISRWWGDNGKDPKALECKTSNKFSLFCVLLWSVVNLLSNCHYTVCNKIEDNRPLEGGVDSLDWVRLQGGFRTGGVISQWWGDPKTLECKTLDLVLQ